MSKKVATSGSGKGFTEQNISLNNVYSRSGKATGNMYLALAKHKRQQSRQNEDQQNQGQEKSKRSGGYNILQARRTKLKEEKTITVEEIDEHIKLIERRKIEENERERQKQREEAEKRQNSNTRFEGVFVDKLIPRKEAMAVFKVISRDKRNNLPDGKGILKESRPDFLQYQVKYNLIDKKEYVHKYRDETENELRQKNEILPADTSICPRLVNLYVQDKFDTKSRVAPEPRQNLEVDETANMTNIITNNSEVNSPTKKSKSHRHTQSAKVGSRSVPQPNQVNDSTTNTQVNEMRRGFQSAKKPKLQNGRYKVEELDLDPSLYVPFQNANLCKNEVLIVKNLTKVRNRMQEEIKIEIIPDASSALKPTIRSTPSLDRQYGKQTNPNSRYSLSQPFNELCARFPEYAARQQLPDAQMRPHTSKVTPSKTSFVQFWRSGDGHKMIIPDNLENNECERNDYDPQTELASPRQNTGFIELSQQVSREKLPTGRPQKVPNLVKTRVASGISIDEIKAAASFNHLAHVPNQEASTNFTRTKSRDLGYFMSDDRLKNILHDNKQLLQQQSQRSLMQKSSRNYALSQTTDGLVRKSSVSMLQNSSHRRQQIV